MKRALCMAVVGLASVCCWAQTAGMAAKATVSEPMSKLTNAYIQISAQNYEAALADLVWCYDNGAKGDPNFESLRNTAVIDAIVGICPVYPNAVTVLETKRSEKSKLVGDSPKIDNHFFDLLALNRALEDDKANELLLQKVASSDAIKKFSGKSLTSQPPKLAASVTAKDIKLRADAVRMEVTLKPCADAKAKLEAAKAACDADAKRTAEEQAKMQSAIASMRDQLDKLSPEEQGHLIDKMREMVRQLRDEIQVRQAQLNKEKAFYEELVKWCANQKEEAPPKKG